MSQSDSGDRKAAATDRRPLRLVLPICLLIAGYLTFLASITVCGIFGCNSSQGAHMDVGGALKWLVSAVLVLAIPCALVRWHPRPVFRWGISFLGAIILVAGGFFILLASQNASGG